MYNLEHAILQTVNQEHVTLVVNIFALKIL
jgi:hypothetical protein